MGVKHFSVSKYCQLTRSEKVYNRVDFAILAKLQNTGPLLIIHQTSRLVWLVCSFVIHCRAKRAKRATRYIDLGLNAYRDYSSFFIYCRARRAKRATKHIDLGFNVYMDYSSFFYPLPSQKRQTSH